MASNIVLTNRNKQYTTTSYEANFLKLCYTIVSFLDLWQFCRCNVVSGSLAGSELRLYPHCNFCT